MIFLDTSICTAIIKGQIIESMALSKWLEKGTDVNICAIVAFELSRWIPASSKRQFKIDEFLKYIQVQPLGKEEAILGGQICRRLEKQGKPIGSMDCLIAAQAIARGAEVSTHNARHFSRIEEVVLNRDITGQGV